MSLFNIGDFIKNIYSDNIGKVLNNYLGDRKHNLWVTVQYDTEANVGEPWITDVPITDIEHILDREGRPLRAETGVNRFAGPQGGLDVFRAPHIGNIGSPPIDPNHENSISGDRLVAGNDYVRIKGDNNFIYDPISLQTWFHEGHNKNPLTNEVVNQNELERFTYIGSTEGGRRRRLRKNRKSRRRHHSRRKNRTVKR